MELPRLSTVEGAYSYLMGLLLLLSVLLAAYVAAIYVGAVPAPPELMPA